MTRSSAFPRPSTCPCRRGLRRHRRPDRHLPRAWSRWPILTGRKRVRRSSRRRQRDRRHSGDRLRAQRGGAAVGRCRRRRLHDDLPGEHAANVLHRYAREGACGCHARHVRGRAECDPAGRGGGRSGHGARHGAGARALWQPETGGRDSARHQARRRGLRGHAALHGGELQQSRPVHQLAGGGSLLLPGRQPVPVGRSCKTSRSRRRFALIAANGPDCFYKYRSGAATSPRASSRVRNSTAPGARRQGRHA